jgi:activator of HSP90 ATPase
MNLELCLNGETVGKLEIDASLLSRLLQSDKSSPAHPPVSSPLTKAQAQELLSRLDKRSAEFLTRLAAHHGLLTWGETKTLFDVRNWEAFASGSGKQIAREVRHVLHDRKARLVWRIDHEWEEREEGEDEICRLHIDGAALTALREATGLG